MSRRATNNPLHQAELDLNKLTGKFDLKIQDFDDFDGDRLYDLCIIYLYAGMLDAQDKLTQQQLTNIRACQRKAARMLDDLHEVADRHRTLLRSAGS